MIENKFIRGKVLKDGKIAKALEKAKTDYENGEIIEVRDTLCEIIDAIDTFIHLEALHDLTT